MTSIFVAARGGSLMFSVAVAAIVFGACSSSSSPGVGAQGGAGGSLTDASAGSGGAGATGGSGATTGTGGTGGAVPEAGNDASNDAAIEAPAGWKLVWDDEFNGTGLADSSKWGYEVGFIRNNEAQYYTDARLQNARQENGNLVIEAIKESYQGANYTSASLNTKGKYSFLYGRIDVRAKIPTGRGSWPAIWTLGTNVDQVGWPQCGEIDIMENVGFTPNTIYCTVHVANSSGNDQSTGKQVDVTPSPYSSYHIYSMQWSSTQIVLSVDSKVVLTYANDGSHPYPFTKPQYLLLNLAIGGAWGGQQGIDNSIFPLYYYIDYVRYYQKAP